MLNGTFYYFIKIQNYCINSSVCLKNWLKEYFFIAIIVINKSYEFNYPFENYTNGNTQT
jgi:hypothetical protein